MVMQAFPCPEVPPTPRAKLPLDGSPFPLCAKDSGGSQACALWGSFSLSPGTSFPELKQQGT